MSSTTNNMPAGKEVWRSDILRTIKKADRENLPLSYLKQNSWFAPSTSTIARWIDQADERGLVEITKRDGQTTLYHSVSDMGKEYIQDYHPCHNDWEASQPPIQIRLHYFSVLVELAEFESMSEDWKKKAAQSQKFKLKDYDSDNKSVGMKVKDVSVVLAGNKAIFQVMEDISGYEVPSLVKEAVNKVQEAIEIMEEDLGRVIEKKPEVVLELNTEHIAVVRDPFAEFIQEQEDVDLVEVKIRDDEGELRLFLDCSEYPELEAGFGNSPSSKKYYSEADIMYVKEKLYEFIISDKEKWNAFISAMREAEPEEIRNMFK